MIPLAFAKHREDKGSCSSKRMIGLSVFAGTKQRGFVLIGLFLEDGVGLEEPHESQENVEKSDDSYALFFHQRRTVEGSHHEVHQSEETEQEEEEGAEGEEQRHMCVARGDSLAMIIFRRDNVVLRTQHVAPEVRNDHQQIVNREQPAE